MAFYTYQIQHRNPLAFLAYVFFLASIAVAEGPDVLAVLKSAGIPAKSIARTSATASAARRRCMA